MKRGRVFQFTIRDEWNDDRSVYRPRLALALKRMLRGLGFRVEDMKELPRDDGQDVDQGSSQHAPEEAVRETAV